MSIKVALCGPPHSGKSCLREGLKQAIRRLPNAPYPYVITACPDGEGAWFSETAQRNPQAARKLKEAYKSQFTWEFACARSQWVKDCNEQLVLVDVGGKIDEKNTEILQYATHAIILAGAMSQVPQWEYLCHELGLKVIAILFSDYDGKSDVIEAETPILRGSIHYLERGEDVSQRPVVQALARVLVKLTQTQ